MAVVAVLVASFSLRENEPNRCNIIIAKEAVRICSELVTEGHIPIMAIQWEAGLGVHTLGTTHEGSWQEFIDLGGWMYHEIGQYDDGRYLGTKELFNEAISFFEEYGATHFVGVANPFIHQPYLYWLARKRFTLMRKKIRKVGFDKQSSQWWCRSWWQLLGYIGWITIGGTHGHRGRQVKA